MEGHEIWREKSLQRTKEEKGIDLDFLYGIQ